MKKIITLLTIFLLPYILCSQADFGDAPDGVSWWGGTATFPTLNANTGPKHTSALTSTFWIGGLNTSGTLTTTVENEALVVNQDLDDGSPKVYMLLIGNPAPSNITIPITTSSSHAPSTDIYINVAVDVDNDLDFMDDVDLNWIVRNEIVRLPADTTLGFDFGPFGFGSDLVLLPVWIRVTVTSEAISSPWNGEGKVGGWTDGETEDWWFGIGNSAGQNVRLSALEPPPGGPWSLSPSSKPSPASCIQLIQPQMVYVPCEQTKCIRIGVKDSGDLPVTNISMEFSRLVGTSLASDPTVTGTPSKIGNTTWFNICVTGWDCDELPLNRFAKYIIKVTYNSGGIIVVKDFEISFGNNQSSFGYDDLSNSMDWMAIEPVDTTGYAPWFVNQGSTLTKQLLAWEGMFPDSVTQWSATGNPNLTILNPSSLPAWMSFNESFRSDDGDSARYTFVMTPPAGVNGLMYVDFAVASDDAPTDNFDTLIWRVPIYITETNSTPNLTKEFGAAYSANTFLNKSIQAGMKAVDADTAVTDRDSLFFDFYLYDETEDIYHNTTSATFAIGADTASFLWVPTRDEVGSYRLVGQVWDSYLKMDTTKAVVNVFYLEPDFVTSCPVGYAPYTVTFTDASIAENITNTEYKWNFGDNTPTSNLKNPTHTYNSSGTYTVTLEVYNGVEKVEEVKTGCIVVNKIDFSADPTSGLAPFEVTFRNLSGKDLPLSISSNTTTSVEYEWIWELGNEHVIKDENPQYTYEDPGIYSVSLTGEIYYTYFINDTVSVTDTIRSEKLTKVDFIRVYGDLGAEFEADTTNGYAPLTVSFTDLSFGTPSAWLWTFGDGTPDATTQNVVHVFNNPGVYNISLTVYRGELSNKKQVSEMIEVHQPVVAAFTGDPLTGSAPLSVAFTNQSLGDPAPSAWYWDFGDGTHSLETGGVHLYREPGTFDVMLIADNGEMKDTLIKQDYITIVGEVFTADFIAEPLAGPEPLSVQFNDQSTGSPTEWLWNFGPSSATSTEQNPSYEYIESGTYTVSLYITNGTDEDTEVKENYIIVGGTGIKEIMQTSFELFQNYPNPLKNTTTIDYSLKYSSNITLKIYNVLGEEVKTFVSRNYIEPGSYSVNWDGRDNTGRVLPAGVYYYELTLEGTEYRVGKTREMIIVR